MGLIGKIWKVGEGVEIEAVSRNLFSFHFKCADDRRHVMNGGPWTFDGALITLEEPFGKGVLEDMSFTHSDFWVQIYQVPLLCMTEDIACFLGGMIGMVSEVDIGMPVNGTRKFLRVTVRVDIGKPLRHCLRVDVMGDGEESIMLLFYEHLAIHCFRCGRLEHPTWECPEGHAESVESGDLLFGAWLKAMPLERRLTMQGRRGGNISGCQEWQTITKKSNNGFNGLQDSGQILSKKLNEKGIDFVFKSQRVGFGKLMEGQHGLGPGTARSSNVEDKDNPIGKHVTLLGPREVVDGLDESIGLGLGNLNEHASSLKETEIFGPGCLVVADPTLNRLGKDSQVQIDGKKKSGARRWKRLARTKNLAESHIDSISLLGKRDNNLDRRSFGDNDVEVKRSNGAQSAAEVGFLYRLSLKNFKVNMSRPMEEDVGRTFYFFTSDDAIAG
ncbi:hypothetical protein EZV62_024227 [Acer yangbiense]|uniref:DUF4283 domain-containing protein n=1 Tax=Acer yangbiense TaxID=1000413 RepID=A0A5C7H3Y0_9ROSI|nr:hypothetical protein EZV62_024227 [Acer yangbiense]